MTLVYIDWNSKPIKSTQPLPKEGKRKKRNQRDWEHHGQASSRRLGIRTSKFEREGQQRDVYTKKIEALNMLFLHHITIKDNFCSASTKKPISKTNHVNLGYATHKQHQRPKWSQLPNSTIKSYCNFTVLPNVSVRFSAQVKFNKSFQQHWVNGIWCFFLYKKLQFKLEKTMIFPSSVIYI